MNIYDKIATNFNNNGYGFLKDSIRANVTEVLNGELSLSIEYPINGFLSEYLVKENIIKANVGNDNFQLFRIKYIETTDTRINVYAMHIFYDLADNMLVDVAPTNLACQEAVEWLLARTQYANDFTVYSDIVTTNTQRYVRRNPIEAIIGDIDNSIIKNYGAELERNNKQIKLLSRRGADNHVKVLFGKNIKQIKITEDATAIYTRIMPMGANALLLPETFIDSPLLENYIQPKITKIEFGDIVVDPTQENAYQNEEDAFEEMRNRVANLYSIYNYDKPAISIQVAWIELSKIKEYYDQYSALETVNLGDTITTEYKGFLYTTRVIKTVYNVLLDRIENLEIGTVKPSYTNTTNTAIENINNTLSNPSNILKQAKDEATTLITSAMGGYVYKTQSELYIMDTDDVDTAQKIWRWNISGLAYSETGINGTYEIAITSDGKIVADFITAGSMAVARISGLQEVIDGITTQMNLNDDNIQFLIPQITAIQENGVSKVINTLVEINDDGVAISKEGEQMSLLLGYLTIDEEIRMGLQVNRDNAEMLGVDNTGVRAENVTVKRYLIIGDNSRMENYLTGTGVFYIGEDV